MIERKDFDEKFVLFEKLKEKNMIKKNQLNNFKNTKYEKSIEFISEISNNSNEVQNKIEQSKVMIIGAGGMGNSILRQLIFLGVKNFTLIDFDNVEVTNLNRQEFYKESDIGQNKLFSLQDNLNWKYSNLKIDVLNIKIENIDSLNKINKDLDLVISAIDTPFNYKKTLLNFAIKKDIPIIFGGVGIGDGIYGPFIKTNIYKTKYMTLLEGVKSQNLIPKGSIIFTNEIISTLIVRDVFYYLSDLNPNSLNRIIKVPLLKLIKEEIVMSLE